MMSLFLTLWHAVSTWAVLNAFNFKRVTFGDELEDFAWLKVLLRISLSLKILSLFSYSALIQRFALYTWPIKFKIDTLGPKYFVVKDSNFIKIFNIHFFILLSETELISTSKFHKQRK